MSDGIRTDADKISEHMEEAKRRLRIAHRDRLREIRRDFHRRADIAFDQGDFVEHRVFCMAANEAMALWQELPKP